MSVVTPFLFLLSAVLALPAITASADPGGAGFIEVNAGLLSVKIEKASLSEVLRAVGEQSGAQVRIQGNLGNVQPQSFSGVPLNEGIERLVKNSTADLVMIYNRDKAGHRYLEEIRAYEGNRNSRTFHSHSPISLPAPLPVWLRHTTPVPRFTAGKFRAWRRFCRNYRKRPRLSL